MSSAKLKPIGRAAEIRIGVSGWRYPPWRGGAFYPKGLPQRRELEYASRALPSIELNGSFYSLQRPENYAAWYDDTPTGFVFSVKGSRYITHLLRLNNVETALANFFASGIANLRDKLGPFLWQLPPNFRYDKDRIDRFLSMLPRDTDEASALARRRDAKVKGRARISFGPARPLRHAMEIRNDTFIDPSFVALLRKHRVAFVIADTAGKWPQYEDVTADFAYIRLHGDEELYKSAYMEGALTRWAERIRCWSQGGEPPDARRIADRAAPVRRSRDVFCYFDNTDKVEAPANARRLMEKLGVVWPVELPPMGQRLAAMEGEQRAGSAWEVSRKP
jgi:uncharacterized protein YecE (DUF72 family)